MEPNMQASQGGAPQGGGAPAAGGPPAGGGAGGPQGGGDPAAQLQSMVQQYAQSRDPQLAQQIADTLVQAMGADVQPQGGGDPNAQGGAPAGGGPAGGGGAPGMMRKGGKMPPRFTSVKGKQADKAKKEVAGKRPKISVPK